MKNKKRNIKRLCALLMSVALLGVNSIPSFAATKTQTRTGNGSGCASVKATLKFDLKNGKVYNGKVKKVEKTSANWFILYIPGANSAKKYDKDRKYKVNTSGFCALILVCKMVIQNKKFKGRYRSRAL